MASYFSSMPASDACIDFICRHPDTLDAFINGEPPAPSPQPSPWWRRLFARPRPDPVPEDWPTEAAECDSEINHRNVDLYHWILNGSPDNVAGPGCLFQTWSTSEHTAIDLDGENASFAFRAAQVAELDQHFRRVTRDQTGERFAQWLKKKQKITNPPHDEEVEGVWHDFSFIARQVADCADRRLGLIWVPS